MLPYIICHNIILDVATMFCCHLPCPLSQNSFPCHNRIPMPLLILCRDKVLKCRDNLSIVILHFAFSLLRHSSTCCNKFLQVTLGFCLDNAIITLRHNCISFHSNFFCFSCCFFFLLCLFSLNFYKTQFWVKTP